MDTSKEIRVVDIRSDTLTKPTDEMRKAMAEAEVGDDVFGEDPTVARLETIAADMFEKEKALFVPTGTMGNLLSAMSHCWGRGSQIYIGDNSHMSVWEQGGIAQIGGISPKFLPMMPDGEFNTKDMIRHHRTGENFHHAKPEAVVIENPFDGKVLPISYMKEVHDAAKSLGLKIHMDGARIGNAMVALKCKPTDLTKWVDSANICLSKGLGAPVGSVIVGSTDFINKARRLRKVLGGGMRQSGVLAAAGIISLTKMVDRLEDDHINAKRFAEGLQSFADDLIRIRMNDVQTNVVWFYLRDNVKCSDEEFVKMLQGIDGRSSSSIQFQVHT
uniref:probable low-specificity L-threonine aldolase 2 isoform X2 n=1 Tax=Styela clava TaxID=7725 RepID=UPI001939C041|nr:probable low-specificity L-threonine aldolase 2 isoform X2 [Styela clava]